MYKGKAYNIFLCYRGKVDLQGGVFGRLIYDQLSKITEFEPFFAPAVVDSGDNFMTASRQALEDVKVFILLLTPGFFEGCSADDDMVRDEINTALKNERMRFIPINMPGFDAKTEYSQDVRKCFESERDFTDRVEHIASVPCSDPATFRTTGKLQKAIESAIKAYDADSSGQTPFANPSKATPVAPKKQSSAMEIKDGVLIKCDKNVKGHLVIPAGVTQIRNGAFSGCSGLTSITIPDSVTSIGYGAFEGCSSLESMTVPFVGAAKEGTEGTHFGFIFGADGFYFENDDYVPTSLKKVIITGGTSIEDYAFSNCTGLTSLTIPDSVTSICGYAFKGCLGLKSITIPNSVESIGRRAFCVCSGLKSVTIGNGLRAIGEEAFRGCDNVTRINYTGTKKQWRQIEKNKDWADGVMCGEVHCSDGVAKIWTVIVERKRKAIGVV